MLKQQTKQMAFHSTTITQTLKPNSISKPSFLGLIYAQHLLMQNGLLSSFTTRMCTNNKVEGKISGGLLKGPFQPAVMLYLSRREELVDLLQSGFFCRKLEHCDEW